MTILQSLDGYYGRMADRGEAELPGFSREKISFAIVIAPDGVAVDVLDLRALSGKKLQPVMREVPAAVKRTAGISPNRFWDKTSYVLGRTAGEGKRTADEHAAFKAAHRDLFAGSNDDGVVALLRFLEIWLPEAFDAPPFKPEMLDANVVFQLDGDRIFIHERGPPMFPRLVQKAIWLFCAEGGLNVCNGNRIDDRFACCGGGCALKLSCGRIKLKSWIANG